MSTNSGAVHHNPQTPLSVQHPEWLAPVSVQLPNPCRVDAGKKLLASAAASRIITVTKARKSTIDG